MKLIENVRDMKEMIQKEKKNGKTIGFVPTMGFLHEGHLSLVREAVKKSECSVVSIFVNPAQFGPEEDFSRYPRDEDRDLRLLDKEGVSYAFVPKPQEMYPRGYRTYVQVQDMENRLCGASRPGHFKGVCTVVLKLFHIVQPDTAIFGQKDAQQAIILKRMIRDLNLDIVLRIMPIVRDKDGLALSSRNAYLGSEQREAAVCLYQSLKQAEQAVKDGERNADLVRSLIQEKIAGEPLARMDYAAVVDSENLKPLETIQPGQTLLALAVFIGETRLIDNMML